ncbi:MAG: sigma-70 family RNA polymerase sigma factor [Fibrobacterales bacterium]
MERLADIDPKVIHASKNGNKKAFKVIFYHYESYANNLIWKITGTEGEHEDLLQEVFFQTYCSLKNFKGNSSFKTWFHRIVTNTCTARWRHLQAAKRPSAKATKTFDELPYEIESSVKRHDTEFELKSLVNQALDTLNEKLRVPLELDIYQGLNHSEIASMLNIPEGTVKSRLFTARKQLKLFFDKETV